jgi:hypothetical protein
LVITCSIMQLLYIALWACPKGSREINFRSQVDFRNQLINLLLEINKDVSRSKKKRVSHINQDAESLVYSYYQRMRVGLQRQYIVYAGLRVKDRPLKRAALAIIAGNKGRPSIIKRTRYACKQYDVSIC